MSYEYIEVEELTASKLEQHLNEKNIFIERAIENDLLAKAIDMLKMWGFYNKYKSYCGYKSLALYKNLNKSDTCDMLLIDSDIEFIESALLKLKNSKMKKDNQLFEIVELFYKGVDIVNNGYEKSEQLNTRQIAKYLDISQTTVCNRLKAAESYIVAELSRINLGIDRYTQEMIHY